MRGFCTGWAGPMAGARRWRIRSPHRAMPTNPGRRSSGAFSSIRRTRTPPAICSITTLMRRTSSAAGCRRRRLWPISSPKPIRQRATTRALIDDKRKQYDAAEDQLRRAAELAPKQVGRFIALGKYLAGRGQYKESDAMFDQAARLAPDNPQLLFERASVYVKARRNLGEARELLEKYLRAPLTPDDPPREQAEALLRKIGAGS